MEKKEDKKILNQEILGGLKAAIARGSTLKDAMMSFYQAGYFKTEIEEAARVYVDLQKSPEEIIKQKEGEKKPQKTPQEKSKEKGNVSAVPIASEKPQEKKEDIPKPKNSPAKKPKVVQRVSQYDIPKKPKPPKSKALTFVLIFTLLFLIGALAAVFLFKAELVEFFNSFFT